MKSVDAIQKLRIFFMATFGWSLFFWSWALKNTVGMNGEFDLGVISFGTVMISSSYMLGVTVTGSFASYVTKSTKAVTTGTHLFVALNYLLGSYIGFVVLSRPGFGLYCVIFTILWLWIAYSGQGLMNSSTVGASIGGETLPLSA